MAIVRQQEKIMRKLMLGLMALTAVGAATLTTSAPAAAGDYAYCLQGRDMGYPGDCSYSTYAQCMASASGRYASCGINPRVAYGQAQYPRGRGYY
jgi:hypothetical protein